VRFDECVVLKQHDGIRIIIFYND